MKWHNPDLALEIHALLVGETYIRKASSQPIAMAQSTLPLESVFHYTQNGLNIPLRRSRSFPLRKKEKKKKATLKLEHNHQGASFRFQQKEHNFVFSSALRL